jgi:hypothetical protein
MIATALLQADVPVSRRREILLLEIFAGQSGSAQTMTSKLFIHITNLSMFETQSDASIRRD